MLPYRRLLYSFGALVCLAALMAACGGASPTLSPVGAEQTDKPTEPAAPTAQPPPTEFTSPLPHEQSPLPAPVDVTEAQTAKVPQDLLDAVFDDLLERLDVGREAIAVEQAEYIIWRDGSLGCPQKGMMYTQALVSGFQIILRVGDETFDYHASEGGHLLLCEGGLATEGLLPGEGSGPLVDPGLEPLIAQARSDLAGKLSIHVDQIEILEARAVVWPDASLGCPLPGMEYKQVPMDGALILLTVDGKVYEYHSGGERDPFLCEQPATSQEDRLPPIDLLSLTPGSPSE